MFNWLKNLFSKKVETPATVVTPVIEDSQALVAEAPYVEGVTTEVVDKPKAKKKRYYKPKAKKPADQPKAEKPAEKPVAKPRSKKDPNI